MKMSIDWHETCLKNRVDSLERDRRLANNLLNTIKRKEGEIDYYKKQIEEAKKKNKDGFDPELFLKTKTKKEK